MPVIEHRVLFTPSFVASTRRLGREEALEGLDDDGGETVGMHGEQRLHRGQIVVGRDEHLGVERLVQTRAAIKINSQRLAIAGSRGHHGHLMLAIGSFQTADL